jgi:hypothetical protein
VMISNKALYRNLMLADTFRETFPRKSSTG